MSSPGENKATSPSAKVKKNYSPEEKVLSSNSRKLAGFKPKQLSDLKSIKPVDKSSKSPKSPLSKHERSFSGLFS